LRFELKLRMMLKKEFNEAVEEGCGRMEPLRRWLAQPPEGGWHGWPLYIGYTR
jgi:hypothetical protein